MWFHFLVFGLCILCPTSWFFPTCFKHLLVSGKQEMGKQGMAREGREDETDFENPVLTADRRYSLHRLGTHYTLPVFTASVDWHPWTQVSKMTSTLVNRRECEHGQCVSTNSCEQVYIEDTRLLQLCDGRCTWCSTATTPVSLKCCCPASLLSKEVWPHDPTALW